MKSVQSIHPCESLPCRQAGVVQTFYDIVKAHGGELSVRTPLEKVETKHIEGLPADLSVRNGVKAKLNRKLEVYFAFSCQ